MSSCAWPRACGRRLAAPTRSPLDAQCWRPYRPCQKAGAYTCGARTERQRRSSRTCSAPPRRPLTAAEGGGPPPVALWSQCGASRRGMRTAWQRGARASRCDAMTREVMQGQVFGATAPPFRLAVRGYISPSVAWPQPSLLVLRPLCCDQRRLTIDGDVNRCIDVDGFPPANAEDIAAPVPVSSLQEESRGGGRIRPPMGGDIGKWGYRTPSGRRGGPSGRTEGVMQPAGFPVLLVLFSSRGAFGPSSCIEFHVGSLTPSCAGT